MKNAGMRIRIEEGLRDDFIRLCKERDIPAAQVLRAFMKSFVEKEGCDRQVALVFTREDVDK